MFLRHPFTQYSKLSSCRKESEKAGLYLTNFMFLYYDKKSYFVDATNLWLWLGRLYTFVTVFIVAVVSRGSVIVS